MTARIASSSTRICRQPLASCSQIRSFSSRSRPSPSFCNRPRPTIPSLKSNARLGLTQMVGGILKRPLFGRADVFIPISGISKLLAHYARIHIKFSVYPRTLPLPTSKRREMSRPKVADSRHRRSNSRRHPPARDSLCRMSTRIAMSLSSAWAALPRRRLLLIQHVRQARLSGELGTGEDQADHVS